MIVVLIKAKTKLWSHSRLHDIHNSTIGTIVMIDTVNEKLFDVVPFYLFILCVCGCCCFVIFFNISIFYFN